MTGSASTSHDVDLLAEGPADWESPESVSGWRDAIEDQYLDLAEPVLNDFLRRVRALAEEYQAQQARWEVKVADKKARKAAAKAARQAQD